MAEGSLLPPLPPWLGGALQSALAQQKGHALLICGPAGAGQFEFASALALAWLCTGAPRPCGDCPSCRQASARVHPDLLVIVPELWRVKLGWAGEEEALAKPDAKPSKEIRVEQLRQAIAWAQGTSARGQGKVLLVYPADAMNLTAASALLKTLEEPPGRLRLVLGTSDPEQLLPTVRSRCQWLRLPLPDPGVAQAWLAERGVKDAQVLLKLAAGGPQAALELAEEGVDADWAEQFPDAVARADVAALVGKPVPVLLDLLLKLAHDWTATAAGGRPRYFAGVRRRQAGSMAALLQWQRSLIRVARHADHPWSAALLIEALVTEGARAWAGTNQNSPHGRAHSLNSIE